MQTLAFILGKATAEAFLLGTFAFYLVKGFLKLSCKWLYVVAITFFCMAIFNYIAYPEDVFKIPIFSKISGLIFVGGIVGAIRFCWTRRKQSTTR